MPIVCHCNVITKDDFKKATQKLDVDPNASVKKVAGMLLLNARAGKTCLGGCHSCLPEIRKIVEEERKRPVQDIPVRVHEHEPA